MTGRGSSFVAGCRDAFRKLVDEFGFSEPEVESIGRETFVRYHRGDETVSVACEIGGVPIVELFYPCAGTSDRPTPWAERDGVARARRIPRLDVGKAADAAPEDDLAAYLLVLAHALEKTEHEFLARSSSRGT